MLFFSLAIDLAGDSVTDIRYMCVLRYLLYAMYSPPAAKAVSENGYGIGISHSLDGDSYAR